MKKIYYVIFAVFICFSCKKTDVSIQSQIDTLCKEAFYKTQYSDNKDSIIAAINLMNKAIELKPNDYRLYASKVNLALLFKKYDMVFGAVDTTLMLKPDYAEMYYVKGAMLIKKNGDTKDVNRYLEKAITLYDKRLIESSKNKEANLFSKWLAYFIIHKNRQAVIDSLLYEMTIDTTLNKEFMNNSISFIQKTNLNDPLSFE